MARLEKSIFFSNNITKADCFCGTWTMWMLHEHCFHLPVETISRWFQKDPVGRQLTRVWPPWLGYFLSKRSNHHGMDKKYLINVLFYLSVFGFSCHHQLHNNIQMTKIADFCWPCLCFVITSFNHVWTRLVNHCTINVEWSTLKQITLFRYVCYNLSYKVRF